MKVSVAMITYRVGSEYYALDSIFGILSKSGVVIRHYRINELGFGEIVVEKGNGGLERTLEIIRKFSFEDISVIEDGDMDPVEDL
jgi:hypothetical protein